MSRRLCVILLVCVLIISAVGIVCDTLTDGGSADAATALKRGSTGSDVRKVQTKLKNWGYYNGGVDGIYGSKTEAAVRSFQQKNGLTVDGVVGSKTALALGITLSGSASSSASSSSQSGDMYLLARVVYAEARGEPYSGQVAVAAVVLNRVASSKFPNTIAGVVYQPYAFTCVADGQINYTPDQTAINAARDAMNGWDPTYGALYYYNPVTATSAWIRSLDIHMTIGRHVFAR